MRGFVERGVGLLEGLRGSGGERGFDFGHALRDNFSLLGVELVADLRERVPDGGEQFRRP